MPPSADALPAADLDLLTLICCVAWSDGEFSGEERRLLEHLVQQHVITTDSGQPVSEQALAALADQALPLDLIERLVPRLGPDDRQLALKLAYQMVRSDRRPGDSSSINAEEKVAYRRLVEALGLAEEDIAETEWMAEQELGKRQGNWLAVLAERFGSLGSWPSPELLQDPSAPRL